MSDNHFIILITGYNTEKYIKRCIDSAMNQTYKNYEIVIMDDCSIDGTWDIIQQYDGCIKYRSNVRKGDSLPNVVIALQMYSKSPEDIIVHLDGDDYLAHGNVLNRLNEAYDNGAWITYGQFEPLDHAYHDYCTPIPDIRTYRKSGIWRTSHLKTHKKWLWDKIDDKDLRKETGDYFGAAEDNAFMYPMIEMAGAKHVAFIPDVLYLYNNLNPHNYMKGRADELIKTAEYIRNKPIYAEL